MLTPDREYDERQVVELESIDNLRMMNNNVLIRIDDLHGDGDRLKSGIYLGGSKYNETTFVSRYGTVVSVPPRLVYRGDFIKSRRGNVSSAMEWITAIDIEVGDVVYWGTIAAGSSPLIKCNDVIYYLVHYSELRLRVRNDVITMLNGYALVDEVEKEGYNIDGLVLDFSKQKDKRLGTVTHVGIPNNEYHGSEMIDADIEVGDTAVFLGDFWTALEDDLFETLGSGVGYIQRCWIIGKV